jgi:hypothetical protein
MPKLVGTGATLRCSQGTAPATFAATGTRVLARGPAGVVTDTTATNVPAFGMCVSPNNPQVASATQAAGGTLVPQPCQPVLTSPWSPGSARVTIGGTGALGDAARCTCSWGGVLTVTDPGQAATSAQ